MVATTFPDDRCNHGQSGGGGKPRLPKTKTRAPSKRRAAKRGRGKPRPSKTMLVPCTICTTLVLSHNINKHINKFHNDTSLVAPKIDITKTPHTKEVNSTQPTLKIKTKKTQFKSIQDIFLQWHRSQQWPQSQGSKFRELQIQLREWCDVWMKATPEKGLTNFKRFIEEHPLARYMTPDGELRGTSVCVPIPLKCETPSIDIQSQNSDITKAPPAAKGVPHVPDSRIFVHCSICKCSVKKSKIENHIKKVHRNGTPHIHKKMIGPTIKPIPLVEDRSYLHSRPPDMSHQKAYKTDIHDASRWQGHCARERGRFGSYPAFDSMDDESSA